MYIVIVIVMYIVTKVPDGEELKANPHNLKKTI